MTMAADNVNFARGGFQLYLPTPDTIPLSHLNRSDIYEFSKACMADPWMKDLVGQWTDGLESQFYGITMGGSRVEGIYELQDEGAPTKAATTAANRLVDVLSPDEKLRVLRDLDSEDWRKWTNTEIVTHDVGVLLASLQQSQVDLVWALFESCLSQNGYAKVKNAVNINKYLGTLANTPAILNEYNYNFMLFGSPSMDQPWGFSLSGHHLILTIFFVQNQMTIGPAFIGCEPNVIVEGANKGAELFQREILLALKLMQNLTPAQQRQAQKTDVIHEPEKPGWNAVDQRHLTGTSQDNRIIPYEGVAASEMTFESQDMVVSIIEVFQELLPPEPLAHRLRLVRQHLSETYFTWTGKFGDNDPFYFRIQSPVVLVEMDHHTGIYLTNREPDKFHIHTIHRLPNGGDYGRELIRKWRQAHPMKPATQRMEYVRPFNEQGTVDTGFPKYRAQILSSLESAIILASHIGGGGSGPGLHYHHSDQAYFLLHGAMKARLGDVVHDVSPGSLVFIPAGLPHCNWNLGPDSETHLEMIIPATDRLKQIAYMVDKPEDVPPEWWTSRKGYVRRVDPRWLKEPLPGFKTMSLADPSSGCDTAVILYAEVGPHNGGPDTHVHLFDQYYFVLEGELTIEVALQKYVVAPKQLVVLPAGVPHRQYNKGDVAEKHLTINTPAPEPGRLWDFGVKLLSNGVGHYGSLSAASEIDDGALSAM